MAGKSLAFIATIVFTATSSQACKPKSLSTLQDAATTSSYKSGFFMPRLKKEYSARVNVRTKALTPGAFLAKLRKLTKKPGLVLWKPENLEYAVTVSASGEQVLLAFTRDDIPDPVLSITAKGQVFSWGPYVKKEKDKSIVSDLFARWPYDGTTAAAEKKLKVENMFVRRMALNSDGFKEPILVPWLAHVKSETGAAIVYRLGNTLMDARAQKPALEFRRIGEGPAWAVVGPYKDGEVEAGTVFYKSSKEHFISITPGSGKAVLWQRQDGDSIDRVSTEVLAKVKVPTEVQNYLYTLPSRSNAKHPANQEVAGFDWYEGDSGVLQLERNDLTFGKARAVTSGLALTGTEPEEKTEYTEADYAPRLGLAWYDPMSWWIDYKNEPVRTTGQVVPGVQGASYTDQSGQSHGGAILAQRRTPDGDKVYTILNRTNNTVADVNADGTTRGIPLALSDYQARANVNIDLMDRMKSTGQLAVADGRAISTAQGIDARTTRQIERSESLVGGNSIGGMAGGLLQETAISAVTTEAKAQSKYLPGSGAGSAIDKALIGEASRTLAEGAPVGTEGFVNHADNFAFDTIKEESKGFAQDLGGKKASDWTSVVADTTLDGYNRWNAGDFSTTNPDFTYDSRVSTAGIAGTFTSEGIGAYAKGQVGDETPGRAFFGDVVSGYASAPFAATEAYSRGIYAETLSGKAGEELNERVEMRQVNTAYQTGLESLGAIQQSEPSYAPTSNQSAYGQAPVTGSSTFVP